MGTFLAVSTEGVIKRKKSGGHTKQQEAAITSSTSLLRALKTHIKVAARMWFNSHFDALSLSRKVVKVVDVSLELPCMKC